MVLYPLAKTSHGRDEAFHPYALYRSRTRYTSHEVASYASEKGQKDLLPAPVFYEADPEDPLLYLELPLT